MIKGLTFSQNTASQTTIFEHLVRCNESHNPRLDARVDLWEYSIRIYENATTFEAWLDNALVGLVAAYFNGQNSRSAYITDVSVIQNLMKSGIASALMSKCLEYAKSLNIDVVMLEVFKDNTKAIRFYEKFGFCINEYREDSILMKHHFG
jgi:ribosomal protein S18 acetylase RimI-like enzyme